MSEAGFIRPRDNSFWGNASRRIKKLRRNWFLAFLIDFIVIVGFALVLSVLIKAFLIRSFYIPSGSMLDTLQINDRIIVNVTVPEITPISRGDIVVFRDPGGWLGVVSPQPKDPLTEVTDFVLGTFGITAPDSAEHLVKRVIGLPGDVVVCCDADGHITINGVKVVEPYLLDPPSGGPEFSATVPADSYWMLGDNRRNSQDSRYHGDLPSSGFVHRDFVVGRAFVVSWPVSNWSWLGNFPDAFGNVPDPGR
jgi:signal peptidase I